MSMPTLYKDKNYGGASLELVLGLNEGPLPKVGNDGTTSVRVPAGYKVTLYADNPTTGRRLVLGGDVPDLGMYDFDKVTSNVLVEIAAIDAPPVELFTAKLELAVVRDFELQWNDEGSDGRHDGAFYRPRPANGFHSLGDLGQSNYDAPAPRRSMLAVKALVSDALAPPQDFERVWKDSGSGADRNGSFWRPIPPRGYKALGLVSQEGHNRKPPRDCVMCVREDYLVPGELGALVWDDSETGAHENFGAWEVVSRKEDAIICNTFSGHTSHSKPGESSEAHALNRRHVQIPDQWLEPAKSIQFSQEVQHIKFKKNGYPLDYHTLASFRFQHCQDMIRLPDHGGNHYYMGTYSQNTSDDEGGMVFVARHSPGGTGEVVWCDELNDKHLAGGYNHPGDLRRLGNVVVIAGQNWDQDLTTDAINVGGGAAAGALAGAWGGPIGAAAGAGIGAGIGAVSGWLSEPADPMNRGNGGQNILFYDVSNPASPTYMGRLDTFLHEESWISLDTDIDSITLHKYGPYYYLAFNGNSDIGGLVCRATSLSPNACWFSVKVGDLGSPSPVLCDGDTLLASLSGNKVKYEQFSFGSNPAGQAQYSNDLPDSDFGDGTTFSINTLRGGKSYIVRTNVESDEEIEIKVIESTD